MTRRQRQANLSAILVGLVATGVVLLTYALGGLDWLELKTLDLRFCYANSIRAHPDIVHIDIDDRTLELVGRWPWPRDEQAALVSIPVELSAKALLVDLTWVEEEPWRTITPRGGGIVWNPLTLAEEQKPEIAFPDYELQLVVGEGRKVHLAYHYPQWDLERSPAFAAIVAALRDGDSEEAARLARRLEADRARRAGADGPKEERPLDRARIVATLEAEPTLDQARLAKRLGLPIEFMETAFERCRQAALRQRIRCWLDEQPDRWAGDPNQLVRALHAHLAGTEQSFEDDTPLKEALIVTLQEVLGYEETLRCQLAAVEQVATIAEPVEGIVPVHYLLARAADHCGFVTFKPDDDGVMRREALFARHGDRMLNQLAFGLACDLLGITAEGISVGPDGLTLQPERSEAGRLVIQLDEQGRTVVPWLPPLDEERQARSTPAECRDRAFVRIPAAKIWEVHDRRRMVAENERKIRDTLERVLATDYFDDADDYARNLHEMKQLRRKLRDARYHGQKPVIPGLQARLDTLETAIAQREQRQLARLAEEFARLSGTPFAQLSPQDKRAYDTVELLLKQLEQIERPRDANARLRAEIEDTLTRLRGLIEGKICLVGYTATSLADMTPIPVSKRAPGVTAHANLLNGLLTGRLVSWATTPLNVALATILGIGACVVSVSRPPRAALVIVVVAAIAYVVLAGWLAFYWWTYWIALTPALGTMLLSFVAITIYRYFFVDLERRQLATALGQYTSKSIAEKVADDPDLCRRAEMREVTAMFTDLKGFTTISENIGAERTQNLLNTCLGRFTEVMLDHEAMVNKFIGDGIFAFWNPVIYAQPDHALLACETAIDLLVALRELIEEQRRRGGDEAFGELVLRIGLATGNAIVGPCGSEQKFDYTCIGDSVNVAARLESANKFYGTRILVNEATCQQVADRFAFRALGGVQVKGKRQAVQIAELLGRPGQVDDATLAYALAFGQAVALFQERDWAGAREAFEACSIQRPDDLAARHYAEAAKVYLEQPPPDDWNGAIELAEK